MKTADAMLRFQHIAMDTTHLGTWGLDPTEMYNRWKPKVRHVHLSNFDGREHRQPENGRLDLKRLIHCMSADGYKGFIVLETGPDTLKAHKGDTYVLRRMKSSLNIVRSWAV